MRTDFFLFRSFRDRDVRHRCYSGQATAHYTLESSLNELWSFRERDSMLDDEKRTSIVPPLMSLVIYLFMNFYGKLSTAVRRLRTKVKLFYWFFIASNPFININHRNIGLTFVVNLERVEQNWWTTPNEGLISGKLE
jgi:hypothetical protein